MKLDEIKSLFVMAARQLQVLQDHQNKDVCSSCGGACCKGSPGISSPQQFGDPSDVYGFIKNLVKAFRSGRYTVDLWDADDRIPVDTYFIRPSEKGKEGQLIDPSFGGECNFLTDKGCELDHDDRPLQCTTLEPKETEHAHCKQHLAKIDIVKMWIPYQKDLKNAISLSKRPNY